MNWREIDLVIEEAELPGSYIQKIIQPSFETLIFELYKPGAPRKLLICLGAGSCRIHLTRRTFPKSEKPLRFAEFLRSRIRGARIVACAQIGRERIVRVDLSSAEASSRLYIRLWSNAANCILTDGSGKILDAAARRPKKGEISGGTYAPEGSFQPGDSVSAPPGSRRAEKEYEVRALPGEGSFNERLDEWYSREGGELSLEALLKKAKSLIFQRRSRIEAALELLKGKLADFSDSARLKEYGDILMANLSGNPEGEWLEVEDFYHGSVPISIKINPGISLRENAEAYYGKHKKAKSGYLALAEELHETEKALADIDLEEKHLMAEVNPYKLLSYLKNEKLPKGARDEKKIPGLEFHSGDWTLRVGRSAAENDELLRRHVKGSDLWLHARDCPGAYVFIKARSGKSFPLEVLLDAGTLAIFYSKGRNSGEGDLYYTMVKNLRRAKNGPKGLVLPSQERNLRVRIEPLRLRRLKPEE